MNNENSATQYDVIIVGAGAGGGVTAGLLAEAGKSVLLLERGKVLSFEDVGRDHLRNQRGPRYGFNVGPELDGNPRVAVDPEGRAAVVSPLQGGYSNNAACVGSGTLVYGAQAWRFLPQDFRMASEYGVPAGSSLADWPITYEEMAPYYERAEWEMGVAGDEETAGKNRPRHRPYPMPPLPLNAQGRAVRQGAAALGWDTQTVPLLINSVPYNGRAACAHCQQCVGFACPTDAKNGTKNVQIARALATGRCTLETEAMAERIDTDAAGHVVGVTYFDKTGSRVAARSAVVVCSGGAVETARLLLNSRSDIHPQGWATAAIRSDATSRAISTRLRSAGPRSRSGTASDRARRRRPSSSATATTALSAAGCWPTTFSSSRSSRSSGPCRTSRPGGWSTSTGCGTSSRVC